MMQRIAVKVYRDYFETEINKYLLADWRVANMTGTENHVFLILERPLDNLDSSD